MRVLLLLACAVVCALSAPASPDDVTQDRPFIALIKDIEAQPFFRDFSQSYRLLTFEMVTAAESANLGPLIERLGDVQLLRYINLLPKDFSYKFINYAIMHLEAEAGPANESFFKP
ncbi:uncharacterized protein [Littorina saxatilis]|uniref:Uncharacterized protein n=1 Tax=Littorina saxatilis TaxID=31220 RepID=A0AAN9BFP7_9CAEN